MKTIQEHHLKVTIYNIIFLFFTQGITVSITTGCKQRAFEDSNSFVTPNANNQTAIKHIPLTKLNFPIEETHEPVSHSSYIFPNEVEQVESERILSQASPGVYISVGADRALMNAVLAKGTGILVVDHNPVIKRFHEINRALILLSQGNIETYRNLRIKADFGEWVKIAKSIKLNSVNAGALSFISEDNFIWWKEKLRPSEYQNFATLLYSRPKESAFEDTDYSYKKANYLYLKKAFDHIFNITQSGNYQALCVSLSDIPTMTKIFSNLKSNNIAIGVLDTSNVMTSATYTSKQQAFEMLVNFSDTLTDDALIFMTNRPYYTRCFKDARFPDLNFIRVWTFYAFTPTYFKNISKKILMQRFNVARTSLSEESIENGSEKLFCTMLHLQKYYQQNNIGGTINGKKF